MRVYKYPLVQVPNANVPRGGGVPFHVLLPPRSTVLKANTQMVGGESKICLWAEVDENAVPSEEHHFLLLSTGDNIHKWRGKDTDVVFVDTLFVDEFVFHLFYCVHPRPPDFHLDKLPRLWFWFGDYVPRTVRSL